MSKKVGADTGAASTKRKSLPWKLSITLMLLAAPIFLVSIGTFFNHVHELLHKEALEYSSSILNTTMQRVVNYMCAIETAAKANAWMLEENFDPDSLQAISRRIVRLNRSVLSCSVSTEPDVFPQCGRYFSVYSVNEGDTILTMRESDFEYFERAWYQSALKQGKDCWVDPFSDFNEGSIDFNDAIGSYCIPLRPDGKRIEGVLSVDFSFNRLTETVLASEHPFPSAYYMLLGTNGRYLIHPESNLLFKKTIFSGVDSIQHPDVIALGREMMAGKRGVMRVEKNNKIYHVSYAPLPGTHGSLALVCLDDEVLSDYNHLKHLIYVIVAIGLLLVAWITARFVRFNIKPVNQLLEATQKIADGHYDDPIQPSTGKDTVAQLQNAFAAMQQSLISHRESIAHTTEEIRKESEELEKATRQAEESAKAKQVFVGHLLRQIRSPLNIIEGLANVLTNTLPSRGKKPIQPDELNKITDAMRRNAVQLNRMALMLYDSSTTVASDATFYKRDEQVSCNEVARECIDHTRANYDDVEVRFKTELPDSMCIQSNYLYLMRSIREILYNAAKYSDGKHITLKVTQTADTVRFIVEDVGPGLPKEWQKLFLEPFKKGEEKSQGLGLGLPLTKRHVAGLGGELIYDPTYRQGCRMITEMPK